MASPGTPTKVSSSRFDRSIVEGPIPRAVWRLAWPTMLQNVIAGLQGIIDHTMVGHFVGYTGNAAIGVSWQIFLVVIVFMSSLFTGMGVLVARFAGAGDHEKVNRVVTQAFLTAVALSATLATVGFLASPNLLDLVDAAPEVKRQALPFLRTMFVASFGMMLFFMLGGAFRAAGDPRTPLRLGMMMTALNVAFNVVLIPGLGPVPALGTFGAALGTSMAGAIVGAYGISLLFSETSVIHFERAPGSWRPDWPVIRSLFRFGLPTGVQGIAMNVAGVLLLRFIGSLAHSAAAQAAFAVGYTELFSLITWTSVGLMGAASVVAGQNLGAGHPDRAARGVAVAARIGQAVALVVGLMFLVIPDALLGIFGMHEPEVLDVGRQLLGYLSVSGFFITTALAYQGGLQGTGDTKSPLYITLVSQFLLPVGLCTFFQATRGLEAWHIWGAILVGHITRCTLSYLRFRQQKWRTIEVALGH